MQTSSFKQQIRQIVKRGMIDTKRNPVVATAWIILNIFLSFFLAVIYWKLPNDHDNPFDSVTAANRAAFLFMAIFINSTYGTYPLTLTFPAERGVFLKEFGMKLYSLPAYFFGRFIPSIPAQIIHPIIFCVITYWTIGLNNTDESFFFKYLLTNFLILLNSSFIGIIIGAMFKEPHTASIMVVFITLPLVLFSGFLGNRDDYQAWIAWFEYLSPFKYAFEGHMQNQF